MNLRAMLLDTIDNVYSIEDNKEPITIYDYVCSMFSMSEKDGRIRAIKYKNEVLNNLELSDDELAEIVYIEAKATESKGLENSNKLSNRLLQCLCKYYGMSESDIKEKSQSLVKYGLLISPVGFPSSDIIWAHGQLDSAEDHRKEAMIALLASYIDVNVLQHKKPFNILSSNEPC